MSDAASNIDPSEVARFEALAARWWDPSGELRTLHHINPLRLDYVDQRAGLAGQTVLDVGCGAGLLTEAMARRGARVTGLDPAEASIQVARLHQARSRLDVEYLCTTPEALAAQRPGGFDVVTCMEMLEHVPDPRAVVTACAALVQPGGHVFFSTLNRSPRAYLLAVLGAEYLLGLLPRGTHDYARFIRPSELEAWSRAAGLRVSAIDGMRYNPLTHRAGLSRDPAVNYLLHARRDD